MSDGPIVSHAGAAAAHRGTHDIGLIITQVAVPEALAAACALQKVAIDAFPTQVGAVAVCRATDTESVRGAATTISTVLRGSPVLLLHRQGGQVSASRWADGRQQAELAPGLVLDGAPSQVDELVLGTVTVDDLDGVVSSVGMGRWKAARTLARLARGPRRNRG